jgi:ABC-2 type transport system permease protein
MRKILNIAWTNIYLTYTDRSLVLILLLTPIALVTIISLAFSDIGGSSPLQGIPVAIVNFDEGDGSGFNAGRIFVGALVPGAADGDASADNPACAATESTDGAIGNGGGLFDLTDATLLDTRDAAIKGVDDGDYAAAVIIPADFSQRIAYSQGNDWNAGDPVSIEVYGDGGRPISASVIRSVTEGFVNQFVTGQIAVAATINTMIDEAQSDPAFGIQFGALSASGELQSAFGCAFDPSFATVGVDQQSINQENDDDFDPLVAFGSAQAAFFSLFTAAGAASSIFEERRDGTLQRLIVSPTPRINILIGKLIGVFAIVLLQLIFLFLAFTVIGSLLDGEIKFIWGNHWLAIVVLLASTALAGSGVGLVAAAVSKSAEQANVLGSIISIFMGTVGGAFFQVDAIAFMKPITRLSVVFWGTDGFSKLANSETDVVLNVAVLAVIGVAFFLFSLGVFNRRQDI